MYRSLASISRGTELAQRIALGTTVVSGNYYIGIIKWGHSQLILFSFDSCFHPPKLENL